MGPDISNRTSRQSPALSPDGKRLFAIVTAPAHGELMRYDPSTEHFATYPDRTGLSAVHASFSPDGKQLAYVSHPELCLSKMNVDGTGRRRMLTEHASMPQWSDSFHGE